MPSLHDATIENYVVGFIDLLGQKEKLQRLSDLRFEDVNQKDEFMQLLRQTATPVFNLGKRLQEFVSKFEARGEAFLSSLPEADRSQFVSNPIQVRGFSDSMVVWLSLRDDTAPNPVRAIFGILASVASSIFLSMADGYFVRGGLEIGHGIRFDDNVPYGGALYEAYRLESKVAQYPRILIGPKLFQYLRALAQVEASSPVEKASQAIVEACLQLIEVDMDGYPFIDFLGQGFKGFIAKELGHAVVKLFVSKIKKERQRHLDSGNSVLAIRYALLDSYVKKRLEIWESDGENK